MTQAVVIQARPEPRAAQGLKVFEIGLWARVGAILAGLLATILFRSSPGIIVLSLVASWGLQLLATITMALGLGMALGIKGRGKPPLVVAFVLHLVAVVAFAAAGILLPTILVSHDPWEVIQMMRKFDLAHFAAALLGAIFVLVAIARHCRDVGQEMFADKASGTVKLVVILGVLMGAYWWWTGGMVSFGAYYAATLGLRVVAVIVIALYLGVLRQGRRLVADPDPQDEAMPVEPSW